MKADEKGRAVAAMGTAQHATPVREWDNDWPAGVAAWRVGDVLVLMPALLPRTPHSFRRTYMDRVRANATGVCPRCEAVASITRHGQLAHEDGCPLLADSSRWVDRRGVEALAALQGGEVRP